MVDAGDEDPTLTRVPTRADLARVARSLNEHGVRYVVLGGMAIIEWGLLRTTMDLDLLLDPAPENIAAVRSALSSLPDGAIKEVGDNDVANYVVVRVNDEFTIDLMAAACGITYQEALPHSVVREVDGVPIRFATPELLVRTKQTYREKDALDRAFLKRLIEEQSLRPET